MEGCIPDSLSLGGRVALITGSSKGLGFAMAKAMAEHGAHVVINSRSQEGVDYKVAELKGAGLGASGIPFDVADTEAGLAGVGRVIEEQGRLDILVNNAGASVHTPSLDYTIELFRHHLDTHITGAFALSQAALRHMVERGNGRIINITSIFGSRFAVAGVPAYSAAKAGLEGLTRALAAEFGPRGILVNAIQPGYFHTNIGGLMEEGKPLSDNVKEFYEYSNLHNPLGRWAKPGEIGALAVYLASDASSYVNGSVITIDGGITALQ